VRHGCPSAHERYGWDNLLAPAAEGFQNVLPERQGDENAASNVVAPVHAVSFARWDAQGDLVDGAKTASTLRLSILNTAPICTEVGKEVHLVRLDNTEAAYDKVIHGIRAQLTFTHLHTREVFKRTGWFTALGPKRMAEHFNDVISLSSKGRYAWLCMYVASHLPESRGQFWFAGPQGGTVLEQWTFLTHESQRLAFGKWNIHVSAVSDGDDRVEHDIQLHAEG
jgi:hypothetical protein